PRMPLRPPELELVVADAPGTDEVDGTGTIESATPLAGAAPIDEGAVVAATGVTVSTAATGRPEAPRPPTTRTEPLGSTVTVWPYRAVVSAVPGATVELAIVGPLKTSTFAAGPLALRPPTRTTCFPFAPLTTHAAASRRPATTSGPAARRRVAVV